MLRILRGAGDEGLPTLEVGARMMEQTPGVTRLLDRLEAKGLVRRQRCPKDRRQHLCWITAEGQRPARQLDQPMSRSADGKPERSRRREQIEPTGCSACSDRSGIRAAHRGVRGAALCLQQYMISQQLPYQLNKEPDDDQHQHQHQPIRTFAIDKAHSEALFQVRHLITKVRGRFATSPARSTSTRQHPTHSSVTFTIQAASIDTNVADRDAHLRSDDFFFVEKYPRSPS